MIRPDACRGRQIDICDITLAASCTPAANTSDGAIPPPPAALAACRKLLTMAWPQVTEFSKQGEEEAEEEDLIDDLRQPLAHIGTAEGETNGGPRQFDSGQDAERSCSERPQRAFPASRASAEIPPRSDRAHSPTARVQERRTPARQRSQRSPATIDGATHQNFCPWCNGGTWPSGKIGRDCGGAAAVGARAAHRSHCCLGGDVSNASGCRHGPNENRRSDACLQCQHRVASVTVDNRKS